MPHMPLQCDSRVKAQSENAGGFLELWQASVRRSLSEEAQVPKGPKRVWGYVGCRTKACKYPRAMAFMVFALVALGAMLGFGPRMKIQVV